PPSPGCVEASSASIPSASKEAASGLQRIEKLTAAAEVGDVGRGWIRMLFHRALVGLNPILRQARVRTSRPSQRPRSPRRHPPSLSSERLGWRARLAHVYLSPV